MIFWADGEWRDADTPAAPLADRGFALGDGLFETILAERGEPRHMPLHHARLAAGAAALGLPPPPGAERLDALGRDVLARCSLGDARAAVRIVWTAGRSGRGLGRAADAPGALYVSAAPAPRPAEPASLVTVRIRRNETSPTARWKTLSYLDNVMARREAEMAGADEAVMLNGAGRVACAAAATLIAVVDGVLVTPPVSDGALPGITRSRLLGAGCRLIERSISRDDLARAPALALANALIGLRIVARIDGRPLDTANPTIAEARRAVAASN